MIVNLPTWTNIADNSEPWFSGTLNTFLPAGYLEIGIAIGVGMILFILALVSGAARSILNSLGKGSDPLRGIGSANYDSSGFNRLRNNFSSNYGRVGSIGAVNARMARWGNLKGSGVGPKTKDFIVGAPYLNNLENKSRNMQAAERRNQALIKDQHIGNPNYS